MTDPECPYCGCLLSIRAENDGRDETYAAYCPSCHVRISKFVWRAYDLEDVIRDLNRRAKE